MNKIDIRIVSNETEKQFYEIIEEYLPGSDVEFVSEQRKKNPTGCLVAIDNNEVIGVVFGWESRNNHAFVINGIAVRYDYWRQGIGTKLLHHIEKSAETMGFAYISVGSAGGYVEDFYLKNGYHPVEYKIYCNEKIVSFTKFESIDAYRKFDRPEEEGFVVMEKKLI